MKMALIGSDITASLTPIMHEAEGRAHGLNYTYDRIDISEPKFGNKNLKSLLEYAENEGYAGVNVTHPFKVDVLQFVDQKTKRVQDIGASNTVLFREGRRIAHNTDVYGFRRMMEEGFCEKSKAGAHLRRILVIGAGGAGAAVAFALGELDTQSIALYDQDFEKAQDLANRVNSSHSDRFAQAVKHIEKEEFEIFSGLVNATPMGMKAHPGIPIDISFLSPQQFVADIVYFPLETELLNAAKQIGSKTISGSFMAVYQAAKSFSLFTGLPANEVRMARHAQDNYFTNK